MKKTLTIIVLAVFSISLVFADLTLQSKTPASVDNLTKFQTRDLLCDQISDPSAEGGITAQDFESAYDGYDAEGADDFSVPAGDPWTVNQVMVLSSYSDGGGPCELANVRFYADDAGMPGALLFEHLDAPATPDVDGNLDITIPNTVLYEGTYWVSVQGRQDFGTAGQWYWSKQASGLIETEFHWQNPGDGFGSGYTTWVPGSTQWPDQTDFNLSFALYGEIGEVQLTGTFYLDLVDSYGDSWNGGTISILVNDVVILDSVTVETGSEASFEFEVTTGDVVFCDYTEGGWPSENEYYVFNNLNILVASSGEAGAIPEDLTFVAEVLDPVFGSLSGVVTTADRTPVEGADITIGAYSAVTDADGAYLISDIIIGTYDVVCEAYGFIIQTIEAEIIENENTVVDFVLVPIPDGDTIEFPFYADLVDNYYVDTGSTTPFNDDYDIYGGDNNDVVYILEITEAAVVDISLLNSAYDTKLAVYADGVVPGPDNYLYYNDDHYGRGTEEDKKAGNYSYRVLQSALMDLLLLPATYIVIVDGFGTANGDYEIEITADPLPAIYDVQFTEDPSGDSPALGDTVTVTGFVTASNEEYAFFLQDASGPWNGIYCYVVDADSLIMAVVPSIGDEVVLTAVVDEYYGLTELKDYLYYELVSSGNALPAPYVVETGLVDESMEAVLAQVIAATCIEEIDDYGAAKLDDGSGWLYSDDNFFDFEPVLDMLYSVVGPITYSYDYFRILPRSVGDIEDVTNELLWPPLDLEYVIDEADILLDWVTPTQYGWNTYYPGPQYFNRVAPERATLYDITEFGFSYPIELSKVSHTFYDNGEWGDDTDFTFKIYATDGATLLHESAEMTAIHFTEIIYEFDPIIMNDDFWVAVAPVVYNETTGQGAPFSLGADTGNNHGYAGEPGAWEPDLEHATLIYVDGDGTPLRYATSYNPTGGHKTKNFENTGLLTDIPDNYTSQTRALLGFNVYRNDAMLNTDPITDAYYDDLDVAEGAYTYYVTALWHMGESDPSNSVTATLAFGDLEGIVTDSETNEPIVGAIISAGSYGASTNGAGYYIIEGMLVGNYDVSATATLYNPSDVVSAEITDGGVTVVDFALVSSGGGDIYFLDDFEEGAGNWTFDAESSWGITDEEFHSPDYSMHESPGGNYGANLNISSTLAVPWDLSGVLDATLSYWYMSDIETAFDYMYVEITSDGENWLNLATYDEEGGAWTEETISLGGFVGAGFEAVTLRFRFESDGGYEVNGMYIDDVLVTTSMDDFAAPFIVHAGPLFYEGTADDYVFTADIVDVSGIAEANVVYTLDGEDETTLPYTSVDGTVYTFTIPAQDAGVQVDYAVNATDASENSNFGELEGFVYIAGTPFIYDSGVVDFYTVIAEGTGAAVKIVNPAGFQLNLAYALIRNYTDQSGQDNDDMEFHVWADAGGVPGEDLIAPFVISPEASYDNTSAMTRVDLRAYAAELANIQGDFYVGFIVNQAGPEGHVHCTISQPGNFPNSYTFDGANWAALDGASDYHFRAVAELIPTAIGTVEGIVTRSDLGTALEGALVSIGSATGLTEADGSYSIIADPGTQDVTCELDGYNVFNGSVDVIEGDVVTLDIQLSPALWAPVNLAATYNPPNPNVVLQWDEPEAPGGEIVELIYDDGVLTSGYSYVGYSMGIQMSPAEACQILTLKFHTSSGGTEFNAEVWGWDTEPTEDLLFQETVASAEDDWKLVDVSGENLMVDGDFVVTFGSINGDTYLSFDGALDNGRSWDHDDGGGWSSWSEAYLVRAVVQYGSGRIAEISPTPIKQIARTNTIAGERISIDVAAHSVDETRERIGYNVYRDDVLIGSPVSGFYLDTNVPGGTHIYYVTAVYEDPDGESGPSNLVEVDVQDADDPVIPLVTKLNGNYPNPFNPVTNIKYAVSEAGPVSIDIYNIKGEKVKSLVNELMEANYYITEWDGTDDNQNSVSSGVYFYKMKAGRYTSTKKMILMK